MKLQTSTRFRRDVRRLRRRGRDVAKLQAVVDRLLAGQALEPSNRLHKLTGNLAGRWECHIENDWLLVWEEYDDVIFLEITGTHSDIL